MRRYRLGRFAAVVAGGFVVAVIGSAVVSEAVGYLWLLTGVLGDGPGGWATVLPMVALGVLQGWGLWQILARCGCRGCRGSSGWC